MWDRAIPTYWGLNEKNVINYFHQNYVLQNNNKRQPTVKKPSVAETDSDSD